MSNEPDVQRLIRELAESGADPAWVAEAVALEQEAIARRRPQLRLVADDRLEPFSPSGKRPPTGNLTAVRG